MKEDNVKESRRKKSTFKSIAVRIFKETAEKRKKSSTSRQVFRILLFLLFTAGFLYQVIKFLTYLLEYPTVVNIDIISPESYMTPAFTFCNNERIKRSKYCAKYSDRCEEPDDIFCGEYSDYCGKGNITKIPKVEYRKANYEREDVIELAHDFEDLMEFPYYYNYEESFRKRLFGIDEFSKCYTIHSRVNSSLDPETIKREKLFMFASHFRFIFNPQASDSFDPKLKDGIYFSVHSPFDAINPFEKGIFMIPGMKYKVTVSMQEEELLPYPYKTNCIDYVDVWEKNNRTGSRSQDMCRQICLLNIAIFCGNCTPVDIVYPSSFEICVMDQFLEDIAKCRKKIDIIKEMKTCLEKCKEECHYVKYTTEVQPRYVDIPRTNSTIQTDLTKIYVDIDIDDTEVISFTYRPQYQTVEAFSYIGGFIGIWLGVSLVQITDFLESTFLLLRYLCKKKFAKNAETSNDNC